ncbi:hypothetical protein [Streptomyces sp. NPDC058572]|uniref:hypothetical protein n=1 Tax=Streptomyces sp. NPDC058572 TaxID=3346546 RepID=UPI00365EB76A
MCGPLTVEPVTDRHGSAVWKACGTHGTAAIKAGSGDGAAVTVREARAIDRIGLPGYETVHGDAKDGSWLVTLWFDGPSTRTLFQPVRQGRSDREAARTAAVDLCLAVADLHAASWVHADLQPEHALHTGDDVRLIDLSWAWHDDFKPSHVFNGGIPHLLAPEPAASIADGIRPVTPDPAAEVYTLAAVLWTCTTGRWPLDYKQAGLEPKELGAAGLRRAIATRRLHLAPERPWPDLQHVLRNVLLAPAGHRPTAGELAI